MLTSVWNNMDRWVGIAAITVYAPTIFAEAGYGARKSQWLSGLNDVCPFTVFISIDQSVT